MKLYSAATLVLPLLSPPAQPAPSPDDPLCQAAPAATIAWIETTEHAPLLLQGLEHPFVRRVLEHPLFLQQMERVDFDLAGALAAGEAVLGVSPLEILHGLTAGGVGLGLIGERGEEPRPFAVLRGGESDPFDDALETITGALTGFGVLEELDAGSAAEIDGAVTEAWAFTSGQGILARSSETEIIAAMSRDDLAACLGLPGANKELLRASARSRRTPAHDTGTFAWLDLEAFDAMGELDDLRAIATDPGAHFLLGPVLTYLGRAATLEADLEVTEQAVTMELRGTTPDVGPGLATFPSRDRAKEPKPLTPSPNEVGRAQLHRDVGTLLASRAELFSPTKLPGIAEALAGIAIFTEGPDAADELLAALHPRMLLIAENVDFDDNAAPDVAFPAACIIVRLDDVKNNGRRLEGAFRKAVSVAGIENGMQGRVSHELGLELLGETVISTAILPAPGAADGVDVRYNLAPACAVVDDAFVLGTHHALVKSVTKRLVAGELADASRDILDHVSVDGPALARLLGANRDVLVMSAVLKDGKPRRRAELEIDTLHSLLKGVERFEFEAKIPKDPRKQLDARLTILLRH